MLVKFLKIFFFILALMLFAFLVNVTFYFSNYSRNIDFISNISLKEDKSFYKVNSGSLEEINNFSGKTLTGIFLENINKIDRIYFSNFNSYEVNYFSGIYKINLNKGLYFLDLNDLSIDYKISGLGFEIEPKSAGMIFIDTTDSKKILIFSINSVFKFVFKSGSGRKVNYYYMYPHNYLVFNVENNKFSRIGGDVFRIKTVVKDGFLSTKLSNSFNLNGLLSEEKSSFLRYIFFLINNEYKKYNIYFKKLRELKDLYIFGEKYINKYFNYFINDTKKIVYYKQSIINNIQRLYNNEPNYEVIVKNIIIKLKQLKEYDVYEYNNILSIIKGYYKIILKNNSLEDRIILDNFLPLIKFIKLKDSNTINDFNDLVNKIKYNQSRIFSLNSSMEIYKLSKENLDYLYILKKLDKKLFNKIVLLLNKEYNNVNNKKLSKDIKDLINKYYYGVLNINTNNNDLDIYILLGNMFFAYDFLNNNKTLEEYFKEFIDIYFSKSILVNGKIIIGQHIDIVLLKSFLYYLEDYINNIAFDNINFIKNSKKNNNIFIYNVDILEKYLYLNKYIYFINNSNNLFRTGIFKNKYLLNNVLSFIRKNFFKKNRDKGLLVSSNYYNIPRHTKEKLSNIIKTFFDLKDKYKNQINPDKKFRVLLEDYDKLYKKYEEYFLALLNYEEYRISYFDIYKKLDGYKVKNNKENIIGKKNIIDFLSQFAGADFSDIEILRIGNTKEFLVKNFKVNGEVISFKINPDKSYIISNIILDSDIDNKNRFYNKIYSLEREKIIWDKNKKYAKEDEKNKYDFAYFFKNKFFSNYYKNLNKTSYLNEGYLRRGKNFEPENIRVFKRDKLLSENGEFSSIIDILKINYNDIIVKDLEDIIIKNINVINTLGQYTYIAKFDSKYYINNSTNEHYFYDPKGININFYIKVGNIENIMLLGYSIKINFNINLLDFRKIFNNLFTSLEGLENIINYINKLGGKQLYIEYIDTGIIYLNFKKDGEKFEFYLKDNNILYIKKGGRMLKIKKINVFYELGKINLNN